MVFQFRKAAGTPVRYPNVGLMAEFRLAGTLYLYDFKEGDTETKRALVKYANYSSDGTYRALMNGYAAPPQMHLETGTRTSPI